MWHRLDDYPHPLLKAPPRTLAYLSLNPKQFLAVFLRFQGVGGLVEGCGGLLAHSVALLAVFVLCFVSFIAPRPGLLAESQFPSKVFAPREAFSAACAFSLYPKIWASKSAFKSNRAA